MAKTPKPPAPGSPGSPASQPREDPEIARAEALEVRRLAASRSAAVREVEGVVRAYAQEAAWRATDRSARLRRRRKRSLASPDAIFDPAVRVDLVEQAQQIDRDDIVARNIMNRAVDLIVGAGIAPLPATADEAWNARALELFAAASEDCSHDGEDSLGDIQRQAYREKARDGDLLVVLLDNGRVQLVNALRIVSPLQTGAGTTLGPKKPVAPSVPGRSAADGEQPGGTILADGIEREASGPAVRYWVADWEVEHGRRLEKIRPIDAADCLYLVNQKQTGQTRGVPSLAPCIARFEMIDSLIESTLTAAVLQSMMALLVTSKTPKTAQALFGSKATAASSDGRAKTMAEMEPGMVFHGAEGDDIKAVGSAQPSAMFTPFIQTLTRLCGGVMNMPLEIAMLDFSTGNFSQGKAMLSFMREHIRAERARFISQFVRPHYRWVIARAIVNGQLEARDDWARVAFAEPPTPSLQPLQEATTDAMAIEKNLESYQSILARRGHSDWRSVLAGNAEYLAEAKRLGVRPAAAPGATGFGVEEKADAPEEVAAGHAAREGAT